MGPVKDWITDPNVNLGFNVGRAATGLVGAGLIGSRASQSNYASQLDLIRSMRQPFEAAIQSQEQANADELALYNAEAELAIAESEAEAAQKEREVSRFREHQANIYNASGVLLEGSPMLVLDETRRLGQQEIDAIRRRGAATAEMLRRRGAVGASQGRAAIFGTRRQFDDRQTDLMIQAAAGNKQAAGMGLAQGLSLLSPLLGTPAGIGLPRSQSGAKGKTSAPATPQASPAATPQLRGFLPQAGLDPMKMNQLYGFQQRKT